MVAVGCDSAPPIWAVIKSLTRLSSIARRVVCAMLKGISNMFYHFGLVLKIQGTRLIAQS